MTEIKRVAISTGGGDAPGLNAVILARRPTDIARPVTRGDLRRGGGARTGGRSE